MAIKDKNKETNKENRLVSILTKEYRYENVVLFLVALVAGVFAIMIVRGELTLNSDFPVIGANAVPFGWVLFSISLLGLILAIIPFFKPAFPEFKKISWPSFGTWMKNSARVLIFVFIMIAVFALYAWIIMLVGLSV